MPPVRESARTSAKEDSARICVRSAAFIAGFDMPESARADRLIFGHDILRFDDEPSMACLTLGDAGRFALNAH
jgi:hypothetical protein